VEDAAFIVCTLCLSFSLWAFPSLTEILIFQPVPWNRSKTKKEDEELAAEIEQEMRAQALYGGAAQQLEDPYGPSYPMQPPEARISRFNDRRSGPEPVYGTNDFSRHLDTQGPHPR
jgi:hypothetical protein